MLSHTKLNKAEKIKKLLELLPKSHAILSFEHLAIDGWQDFFEKLTGEQLDDLILIANEEIEAYEMLESRNKRIEETRKKHGKLKKQTKKTN